MPLLELHYKGITKAFRYTFKLVLQELALLFLVGPFGPVAFWEVDGDITYTLYSISHSLSKRLYIYLLCVRLIFQFQLQSLLFLI